MKNNIHPIERASILHQKFEEIHPFENGNGRVGREILNFMLRQYKFPLIYIPPHQDSQYYSALEDGNNQDYVPLLDFIMDRIIRTMQYVYSKTSFFNYIKSNGLKEFYEDRGMAAGYARILEQLDPYSNSPELP